MSGGGGGGERTEKATPRRLKKARRDGQIGNTPEVGTWLRLLVATFLIPRAPGELFESSTETLVRVGAIIRDPDVHQAMADAQHAASSSLGVVLPLALVMPGIAIASAAAQGGIWVAPKLLKPKFSRLNPLAGFKRMFGPHGLWQLTKSLLKTAALGVVVYMSIRHLIPTVVNSGSLELSELVHICVSSVLGMLRYAAVAGVVMALADWVVVRRRNTNHLKMTKQEVKEEAKSDEGDPHLRGARRSRQLPCGATG